MKTFLSLVSLLFSLFAVAQQSSQHTVTIKLVSDNGTVPTIIDTLFVNKDYKINDRYQTNIAVKNGIFNLLLENGKYILKFSIADHFILPTPIVSCTKCSNQTELEVFKMENGTSNYFTSVEVSPLYVGGYKSLSKDFKRSLSKTELKTLKDFPASAVIHFFVTKKGEVSDVTFSEEIAVEQKAIISKAIYALKSWRPAQVNGRTKDGEYSLRKEDLF